MNIKPRSATYRAAATPQTAQGPLDLRLGGWLPWLVKQKRLKQNISQRARQLGTRVAEPTSAHAGGLRAL